MDGVRGWLVVLGVFATIVVTSGVAFFVMPAILESIIEDTGWSLTQVSFGVTIWGISAALSSPILGGFIDRFGARSTMFVGAAIIGGSAFMIARVTALWQFYTVMTVAPLGAMLSTYMPAASVVARWFVKHRGVATGIAMVGIGVGGAIFPVVTQSLLETRSWREVYTIMAAAALLAWIPTLLLVRNPESAEEKTHGESMGEGIDTERDLDFRQAMRARSFWMLSFGDMLTGLVFAIFNLQLILYLTADLGDGAKAAQVFGAFQLCVGLGALVFGPLADRFSVRSVAFLCYMIPAGAALFLLPPSFAALAFAFAIVAGLAGGGRSALFPMSLVYCFGERHMAAIWGFTNIFFMIGTSLGPFIGGLIYDGTENTRIVYVFSIVVLAISAFLVLQIRGERADAPVRDTDPFEATGG